MSEERDIEANIARRVRQRHAELQAFVPQRRPLADIVRCHHPAGSPAPGPAGKPTKLRVRVRGRAASFSAAAAALIVVLVAVSLRSGLLAWPAGSHTGVFPVAIAVGGSQHVVVAGSSVSDPSHGAIATSDDGGQTWTSRQLSAPPLNGVAANGQTVLLTADCANSNGPDCVWRSFDGGDSFTDTPGVPKLVSPGLADENRGYVMTPKESGGTTLWETDNAGATWEQTSTHCGGPVNTAVTIDFPSRDASWTACAVPGTGGQETRAIWKSNWEGSTVELMSSVGGGSVTGTLPSEGELMGISMTADGHGWLWTNDLLYFTADGGRTWSPLSPAHSSTPSYVVTADLLSAQTGFAILTDGTSRLVAKTDDNGASWIPLTGFPSGG